ncbi:MAG: CRISPR-associated ring nuclease Csm6 [Verrucomicrobiota bacterium]|nr:CRISPR-associated ring nuclease Csm6 [Limisphaera sp.]MDW8382122.1 CRISPR-associated ring nuclease Csm6 [Verrucomicrobiota bacterium]
MKAKAAQSKARNRAIPAIGRSPSAILERAGPDVTRWGQTSDLEAQEVVLLAVTGMSPAILTETIWALAHPGEGEPPIIPHRVIAVTTTEGRQKMETLFEPCPALDGQTPWGALRSALEQEGLPIEGRLRFGRTSDDVRVITRMDLATHQSVELADIRSETDNEAVADYLLDQVRSVVENPDTRLIASIAGGRKTMSALLYACMTLVGRETDAVTHVLVSDLFEGHPDFWFPGQPGGRLQTADGQPLDPATATVQLAWVPFVSLRQFLLRELGRKPGTFTRLIERCRSQLRQHAAHNLKVTLDVSRARLEINGAVCDLAPAEMLAFLFFVTRLKQNEPPFPTYKDALDQLNEFREEQRQTSVGQMDSWRLASSLSRPWDEHDLARALANLRDRLRKLGAEGAILSACLPERGRCGLDMPSGVIYLRG